MTKSSSSSMVVSRFEKEMLLVTTLGDIESKLVPRSATVPVQKTFEEGGPDFSMSMPASPVRDETFRQLTRSV